MNLSIINSATIFLLLGMITGGSHAAVNDNTSTLMVDKLNVGTAQNWVKGLDAELDSKFASRVAAGGSKTFGNDETDAELKDGISRVLATTNGRERARSLMQDTDDFISFNNECKRHWQDDLCGHANNDAAKASSDVTSCLCGKTNDAFVYCMARLEQEVDEYIEARVTERRRALAASGGLLRGPKHRILAGKNICEMKKDKKDDDKEEEPFEIPSCEELQNIDCENGAFSAFMSALSVPAFEDGGNFEVECTRPLPGTPLEVSMNAKATIPSIPEFLNDGLSHDLVSKLGFEIGASVCLLGNDVLEERPLAQKS